MIYRKEIQRCRIKRSAVGVDGTANIEGGRSVLLRLSALISVLLVSSCIARAEHVAEECNGLSVEAKLLSISHPPGCGYFRFSAVATYSVSKVLSGRAPDGFLRVAVPFPEIARPAYSADAGSLNSFNVGDTHILVLGSSPPNGTSDVWPSEFPPFHGCQLLRADPYVSP